jgi:nitroimidazol reductase NimA-like FMN-containing flavoprotein (pyridoxamine 5'-phosphate oxidase superfamily)
MSADTPLPPGPPSPRYEPTARTRLRRRPQRGHFERDTVHAILDEGLVCHVGFADAGHPVVIPMAYARVGEVLYLHGAPKNRMLGLLESGAPACVTVTLVDGVVLARSAFHQSMNYRAVMLFGVARAVTDPAEADAALRAVVEHVIPGRLGDVRPPSPAEVAGTLVLRFPIEEASAKIRGGGPLDDEADYAIETWAGVVPLRLVAGAPEPDARLAPGAKLPAYAERYERPRVKGDAP